MPGTLKVRDIRRADGPTEQELVGQCLHWLKLHGVMAWRQNQGAVIGEYKGKRRFTRFCSMPGVSDILGIIPGAKEWELGLFLAVECKRPGKQPTREQALFLDEVRMHNGIAFCVHSLEELEKNMRTWV